MLILYFIHCWSFSQIYGVFHHLKIVCIILRYSIFLLKILVFCTMIYKLKFNGADVCNALPIEPIYMRGMYSSGCLHELSGFFLSFYSIELMILMQLVLQIYPKLLSFITFIPESHLISLMSCVSQKDSFLAERILDFCCVICQSSGRFTYANGFFLSFGSLCCKSLKIY